VVAAKEAKGPSSEERSVAKSEDPKAERLLGDLGGGDFGVGDLDDLDVNDVSTSGDYPEILSGLVEKNLHEFL